MFVAIDLFILILYASISEALPELSTVSRVQNRENPRSVTGVGTQ